MDSSQTEPDRFTGTTLQERDDEGSPGLSGMFEAMGIPVPDMSPDDSADEEGSFSEREEVTFGVAAPSAVLESRETAPGFIDAVNADLVPDEPAPATTNQSEVPPVTADQDLGQETAFELGFHDESETPAYEEAAPEVPLEPSLTTDPRDYQPRHAAPGSDATSAFEDHYAPEVSGKHGWSADDPEQPWHQSDWADTDQSPVEPVREPHLVAPVAPLTGGYFEHGVTDRDFARDAETLPGPLRKGLFRRKRT